VTIPSLQTAAVGPPITRRGISLYPVYLPDNDLPVMTTGPQAGLVVDELPEATVPRVAVHNPTGRPVLIVEGEQFVGGRQNRTANTSVLIGPGETAQVEVSCLEVGRWGTARPFAHSPTFTPRRVRRTKQGAVARSMAHAGSRSGDQGMVWKSIDLEMSAMSAPSDTGAIADADQVFARDHDRRHAADELAAMGPLPGQCGVVVAHGWRAVAAEVFGSRDLLAAHWGPLVRSHLLETPTEGGALSATGAMRLLQRAAHAPTVDAPGLGMGTEHHVDADRVTGHALTLDGAIVHAAVFRRR